MKQGVDAAGKNGPSTRQKMTAALRVLAYGTGADSFDEYLRMSETSIRSFLSLPCYFTF